MKKLYTLAAFAAIACTTNAQVAPSSSGIHAVGVPVNSSSIDYPRSANRTINDPDTTGLVNTTDFQPDWAAAGNGTTLWSFVSSSNANLGWIFGSNLYTAVCAQGYLNVNSTPIDVTGALVIFRGKKQTGASSATSKVVFYVYDVVANKACNTKSDGVFNTTTKNSPGPFGGAKATGNILFSDVDTSGGSINLVTFPTPAHIMGDFAVAMDVSTLASGDSVGIISDKKGSAAELDYALIKGGTTWFAADYYLSDPATGTDNGTGNFDANLAIFAIVGTFTGVNEFYNGMKLTTYPNPTVDKATIEYTLEKNSKNVSVVVFDSKGAKVVEKTYAEQAAGTYSLDVPTSNLTGGNYYYQLNANGHNFTKQLVITK